MGRPRERRETGEQDLFRARLDQILNMNHELVQLARTIDWPVLEARFSEVYCDGPGMPPLPTRLMAGLAILKHTFNLSDEVLCERWIENPYFQIDGPAVDVRADHIATRLFTLDQRVVAGLADGLDIVDVEEQHLVALVRLLVVDDRSARMVTVAIDDQAPAALACGAIALQSLATDAVRSAPASGSAKLWALS
jgi:hypothetical protein